jgi:hypothetical protein
MSTMPRSPDPPPGFVAVPLKGAVLVIPEKIFVAGPALGKGATPAAGDAAARRAARDARIGKAWNERT